MNVFIRGQEGAWIKELKELCIEDRIYLYDEESKAEEFSLLITDFPAESIRKGIFSKIPFLVISKEKREEKILEAFEMGAEDYILYPVNPRIVKARILRILSHYEIEAEYLESLQSKLHFTPNEYKILSYMMLYPGKVFSRNELIERAFPEGYEGYDRNIDNYIKQIRQKLAMEPNCKEEIQTVYGMGYRYMP